jgi:hypothetical protein
MAVVPLSRKRFRFSIEEAHDDGNRLAIATVELDAKETLRMIGYLADRME